MVRRFGNPDPENGLDEQERRLWRRVVADVRPLKRASDAALLDDTGKTRTSSDAEKRLKRRSHNGCASSSPNLRAVSSRRRFPAPQEGLDPRTRRLFSRGRRLVDRTVDLHGLDRQRAFERLLRELHSARRRGERVVLVVTGKGQPLSPQATGPHPDGRGVLRRLLPLWLESPKFASLVHRYAPASPRDGGTGAFYLFVRRLRE